MSHSHIYIFCHITKQLRGRNQNQSNDAHWFLHSIAERRIQGSPAVEIMVNIIVSIIWSILLHSYRACPSPSNWSGTFFSPIVFSFVSKTPLLFSDNTSKHYLFFLKNFNNLLSSLSSFHYILCMFPFGEHLDHSPCAIHSTSSHNLLLVKREAKHICFQHVKFRSFLARPTLNYNIVTAACWFYLHINKWLDANTFSAAKLYSWLDDLYKQNLYHCGAIHKKGEKKIKIINTEVLNLYFKHFWKQKKTFLLFHLSSSPQSIEVSSGGRKDLFPPFSTL